MPLSAQRLWDFIGRVFLSSTFAIAVPPKILRFPLVVDVISEKGIPVNLSKLLLVSAIICLTLGVIFLVFNENLKIGASFLLIFLVPTTIIMHLSPFDSIAVFMNLGLIGALILALTRSKNLHYSKVDISLEKIVNSLLKFLKRLIS